MIQNLFCGYVVGLDRILLKKLQKDKRIIYIGSCRTEACFEMQQAIVS